MRQVQRSRRTGRVLLFTLLAMAVTVSGGAGYFVLAAAPPQQEQRDTATKHMQDGNWKDAYEIFQKLAHDPQSDAGMVASDLHNGVQCLRNLGRVDEVDAFREKAVEVHKDNWRVLYTAALTCQQVEQYGFIVAGTFYRGGHRGNDGRPVHTIERDRVRALQLMKQAADKAQNEANKAEVAEFYFQFANMMLDNRFGDGAWRLQFLSDLSVLPDYEEGHYYGWGRNGGNGRGAPVDDKGNPIFHKLPKGWDEAATDGERWRWCLLQASEFSPEHARRSRMVFAQFLQSQFDVTTLLNFGYGDYARLFSRGEEDDKDESGAFEVSTLKEDETIAKLANGIKRFKLPDEFNSIKVYQSVADDGKDQWGEQALNALAQAFEDRQQYGRAVEFWNQSVQQYGAGNDAWKSKRIDQVVGNWGQFDPTAAVPAGEEPELRFVYRNGKHVAFEARELDVKKLLDDVKAYFKTRPGQIDWNNVQIDNVGWRIVQQGQNQYVKGDVPPVKWEMELVPREKHYDRRVTVKAPLKKAGAYLVSSKVADGNESRMVLWVSDTVIVKKPLDRGSYVYCADASTGTPIAKANLEFFGWTQQWNNNQPKTDFKQFAEFTDADGQVKLTPEQETAQYQWLITATTEKKGNEEGRLAWHGFTGIWSGRIGDYDQVYNQRKVFAITDRPVYRPGQNVKFKFWVGQAKYDQEGESVYAGQTFPVEIHNAKGEKVFEKTFTADSYGGFDGEFPLERNANLGQYALLITNMGGGSFRVEEYKKPEFEVTVDAPTDPVALGEKITATIKCKYYFGAPVVNAKVKYKVLRTNHEATWYPAGRWDWFYGPGYWWFACDYPWYPGWHKWGCARPIGWWWGWGQREQPEVVIENEVPVGADGNVKVEIDTALAKELHGDEDHKYEITAEVTDESRRTIVGQGTVLVAREPFKVYAWVDRGHYAAKDVIQAEFQAQTLDQKPVKGEGRLKLLAIEYDQKTLKPTEKVVQEWKVDTDAQGHASQKMKADKPGQYRLSYTVTDSKNHKIEGGYVFTVRGKGFDGRQFRFNDVEIVTDKREYNAGDTVKVMLNTERPDSTVLLFVRPTNGIYLAPKVVRLKGKSTVEDVAVVKRDMPNFFIEAITVSGGRVYNETREVVVPPENRVVNVEVLPDAQRYKPGQKAKVKLRLTDPTGEPVVGSAVVSIYDKSVEYISGGGNVPEIKEFFWKWRRNHYPNTESSANRYGGLVFRQNEIPMGYLGRFGHMVADLPLDENGVALGDAAGIETATGTVGGKGKPGASRSRGNDRLSLRKASADFDGSGPAAPQAAAPGGGGEGGAALEFMANGVSELKSDARADQFQQNQQGGQPGQGPLVEATVRKNFADTALWVGNLEVTKNGVAELELDMPENLTTWKTMVWTMAGGTRVGQGSSEVTTAKDLIVRLQAPRFFTQKDEVVLSANVHNYLKTSKQVKVTLDLPGEHLMPLIGNNNQGGLTQVITLAANGERRVDWRVKVVAPGEATVRMKAETDEESDAVEMRFPVFIHGMLKTDSFSGALRPGDKAASLTINVPQERLIEQSVVEVRYSPSVASAMVDALPYLVDYPYGCTEQTLNRFIPTVVTRKTLLTMGLDLKDIQEKRTNLNAQEIGDDKKRAEDWKRGNPPNPGAAERNPVFDEAVVNDMVKEGLAALANMQVGDGGWGWFSGFGEQSWPHTTAVVVHGLQVARESDVALVPGMLERGVAWLQNYQAGEVQKLKNAPGQIHPWKDKADDLDAFVYMVLADENQKNAEMMDFLYRDRNNLAVYSKACFGIALHKQQENEKLAMVLKNISQFVVQDDENQTAYLKLPENNWWWYWYGTDTEANAFYLKLLSLTDAKGVVAPKLAKYLITNRKHATYWNSTRDTAYCVEALASYITASGEDKPDMTVAISVDGRKVKEVRINKDNFFSFDNKLVLAGDAVQAGQHRIEFTKTGTGPLYFNAYVTNFTLEDPIKKAGLEVKVQRKYYKLVPVDKKVKVSGSRGQALDQKVEKYQRQELKDGATLESGDLVEVELEIDSKNDYEYVIFEDMKAAGFEAVETRSGYNGNDLNAFMELRDERVCFFARTLARGKHSVAFKLRAEIPGKFSALPTRASAMYAPELKANSDENKLAIVDKEGKPEAKPTAKAGKAAVQTAP